MHQLERSGWASRPAAASGMPSRLASVDARANDPCLSPSPVVFPFDTGPPAASAPLVSDSPLTSLSPDAFKGDPLRSVERLLDGRQDLVGLVPLVVDAQPAGARSAAPSPTSTTGHARVGARCSVRWRRAGRRRARRRRRGGRRRPARRRRASSTSRVERDVVATAMPRPSSRKRASLTNRWSPLATSTRSRRSGLRHSALVRSRSSSIDARDAQATRSPAASPRRSHSPAASSTTSRAPRHDAVLERPHVVRRCAITTCSVVEEDDVDREAHEGGVDRPGGAQDASPRPAARRRRPSSPRMRRRCCRRPHRLADDAAVLPAQRQRSARRAPRLSPRACRAIEMIAGSRSTTNIAGKIRKTSGNSILTGAFCARSSAAALRFLRISIGEVAQDLPDRDAEGLALDDPADERPHPGRVDAVEQVLERLGRGESHRLLLKRQAQLLGERAASSCAASRSEPLKPMPASTVTTSRSISSGSSVDLRRSAPRPCGRGRSTGASSRDRRDDECRRRRATGLGSGDEPNEQSSRRAAIAPSSW